jgi:hypothetical protein
VSLSLRDRYCAVLRPDRVDLVRRLRGYKSPIDLKQSVPVEPAADDVPPWLAPVSALQGVVAGTAVASGDLTVVLSNHFVRYLIVPWDEKVGSTEEYQRYAGIAFENVFGEAARSWMIRVSPEKMGTPRLASAIDIELDTALQQVGGSKLRLLSIQPYLMAAFNRLGDSFRKRNFFFLLAEPGRACILAAVGGAWRIVRNYAAADDASISQLVERELRLLETGVGPVPRLYVHAPGFRQLKLPIVNGVAPRVLALPAIPGFAPDMDGALSMALAAA